MRLSILSLAASLALGCVFAAPALAEDEPAEWTSPRIAGARAMQFSILNNFMLGTFEGASLSLLRQRSEHSANRYGLSVNVDLDDADDSFAAYDSVSRRESSRDQDFDTENVELSAHRLGYSDPTRRLSYYGGLGPFLGYGRNHEHQRYREPATSSYSGMDFVEVRTITQWSLGLDGMIGVDWSFTRRFALLAEYSTRLAYSFGKMSLERHQTLPAESFTEAENSLQSTRLYSNGVRFGLSAYY